MNDKIIFAGGGGHALSLLEALPSDETVRGYFDLSPVEAMPVPYLGTDADAPEYIKEAYLMHIAFVYAGFPKMDKRQKLISMYRDWGARFATIIAPSAIITRHASIGEGAAVLNGAIVNRAAIGDHAIINSGAIIEHDCHIGHNTFIAPGVTVGGGTIIGENCFIGLGASIKNGITIASGITVGMGLTITQSLTKPGIYHGNPLRCCPV